METILDLCTHKYGVKLNERDHLQIDYLRIECVILRIDWKSKHDGLF